MTHNMRKLTYFIALSIITTGFLFSSCGKDDKKDDDPVLTDLEQAKKDYTDNYLATKAISLKWTGSATGCNAGDISATVRENVIKRVNYYRNLVGLPNNVTLNTAQSQLCQEAALYMLANHTITHYPSSNGNCYTAGAANAAGHGNLAVGSGGNGELGGNHSVNAVSGYIEDPGSNNLAVGHRAWILYPQLSAMGTGSVYDAAQVWSANCLIWGNNLNGAAQSIEFVAYPPAGYIPSSLVFPRWSFQIYGADFTSASVTMTDANGTAIATNIIHKSAQQGAPDARIAWEPQGQNFPQSITADTEYNVTISGVKNTSKATYTYTVKVFWTNPSQAKSSSKNEIREILSIK